MSFKLMFFVFIVCLIMLLVSIYCAVVIKRLSIVFIGYTLFFLLASVFIAWEIWGGAISSKSETSEAPKEPAYVAKAPLAFYVQDGDDISETYYVEVTEHDTYKFCYFHNDGVHIVKKEVPADKVNLVCQENDLPYRVEIYLVEADGEPLYYELHLPDDANCIQLDKDGK